MYLTVFGAASVPDRILVLPKRSSCFQTYVSHDQDIHNHAIVAMVVIYDNLCPAVLYVNSCLFVDVMAWDVPHVHVLYYPYNTDNVHPSATCDVLLRFCKNSHIMWPWVHNKNVIATCMSCYNCDMKGSVLCRCRHHVCLSQQHVCLVLYFWLCKLWTRHLTCERLAGNWPLDFSTISKMPGQERGTGSIPTWRLSRTSCAYTQVAITAAANRHGNPLAMCSTG